MKKALCFLLACSLLSGCSTWKAVGLDSDSIEAASLENRRVRLHHGDAFEPENHWVVRVEYPYLVVTTTHQGIYRKRDLRNADKLFIGKLHAGKTALGIIGITVAAAGALVGFYFAGIGIESLFF